MLFVSKLLLKHGWNYPLEVKPVTSFHVGTGSTKMIIMAPYRTCDATCQGSHTIDVHHMISCPAMTSGHLSTGNVYNTKARLLGKLVARGRGYCFRINCLVVVSVGYPTLCIFLLWHRADISDSKHCLDQFVLPIIFLHCRLLR